MTCKAMPHAFNVTTAHPPTASPRHEHHSYSLYDVQTVWRLTGNQRLHTCVTCRCGYEAHSSDEPPALCSPSCSHRETKRGGCSDMLCTALCLVPAACGGRGFSISTDAASTGSRPLLLLCKLSHQAQQPARTMPASPGVLRPHIAAAGTRCPAPQVLWSSCGAATC